MRTMRALRVMAGAAATGLVCVIGSVVVLAAPHAGATVDVQIKSFVYTPRIVTIDPGDSVRWTNFDTASHGQVSVEPGFATVVIGQDQSTITTFNVPGTFAYVCSIHGVSMQGTVVVRGTPPETPKPPLSIGHVVQDIFQEARPDVFVEEVARGVSPWTLATAALALGIAVRLAWIARHR